MGEKDSITSMATREKPPIADPNEDKECKDGKKDKKDLRVAEKN